MDALTVASARAQTQLDEAWRMAEAAGHQEGTPEWDRVVDREMDRLREYEEAAVELRKLWDAAPPASPEHPYLVRKGVVPPNGELPTWWPRQDRGDLLIALKGIEEGNPIMSIQRVPADPKRKKLFSKDARAGRCFNSFLRGRPKKGEPLFIAEGFATGWTIHHVTGAAVAIAFTSGNLEVVAVEMRRRFPDVRLVVCADNDWENAHNTGVLSATEAAAACGGKVAIPDFQDREGKSDFNDLYLAEGADAVRLWLDPARASEAATSAPVVVPPAPVPSANGAAAPVDQGPELEPPPEDELPAELLPPGKDGPVTWLDLAPFRCLGYDHGTYFFLPKGTGQITGLTATQHDRKTLLPLAPLSYWEHEFPARKGVSWNAAADALLRASERVGVFRPDRIRGRGCWPEKMPSGEKGILVHLGDRLLAPGSRGFVPPEQFASPTNYMYERQHRLSGPSETHALALTDARGVLDLFQLLLWRDPASAYLAAGWTVLAPVCGALSWRPHIFLTGERGCGKTTVLKELVVPLLGDMVVDVVGQTTEAGLRQELRADALAVVFDEAEEDETAGRRIQAVLALARQASSETGARTLKGTVQGSALQFRIRSMFCLASIGGAVYQEADKSRVSVLQLRGASQVSREERREQWRALAPRLEAITPELGQSLIARTLRLLRSGMLPETVRVFRQAAAGVLGEARAGDQYGTLYAGAWTLMADEPPQPDEARELLSVEDLETYQQEAVPEGKKALDMLLQQMERLDTPNGPRTLAVGQLVDIACGRIGEVSVDIADARLRQIGIRVDIEDGAYVIYLANASEWMKRALRDTMYARGMRTVLLTLPGVTPGGQVRFHPGLKTRTIRVPYAVLE